MKVLDMIKSLFVRSEPRRCVDETCPAERIRQADERLHNQATRLHVLEWEAYGHRHKPPEDRH